MQYHTEVRRHLGRRIVPFVASVLVASVAIGDDLTLLFMGDNGHHRPAQRFRELAPALAKRGILLEYTDRMELLKEEVLRNFDGLILYANIDTIDDDHAKAVLNFVGGGKGFIPLHSATFCWRNNPQMVALMGGQFLKHGTGVFTTEIAEASHPIMRGYGSFTSWDETYIHHRHNENQRTVLEFRVAGEQADGNEREPWTWVRTHGKGRVFYTAWGHDQRTFTNPGFHNLVERGIRWACGDDPTKVPAFKNPDRFDPPRSTPPRRDIADFEYIDVGPEIPNYTPSQQWGTQGKPKTLMQKPLPAEESAKHFVVPEGMAVRLFADERNFQAKPLAMTWDDRGRLWVCETIDYPNEQGGDRDRIRICEDTDGDHVADKFTIFAEGLSIPAAIVVIRGGAVVQNGQETIFLKDTNGDDVADQKTVLIEGWSLGDTHGGVSNFRYGLDNWIWAMQGYNNSSPSVDGQFVQAFRQGFWRFRLSATEPPRVTDLEFIRSSNNNTWGLGISEEGLIFGSTANHNPSMFAAIPNRYYERVRGWAPEPLGTIADTHHFKPITDKVRQVDHHGGYTAAAGHALYTARAFPPQWWNKTAFVCGPTGHLIGTFVLHRNGANYAATSPLNLLASDDEWTAPIMAEVGPDGAVWVIDWYNYIVQHNPTPNGFKTGKGRAYESKLRDKKHGRVYRVVATEAGEDRLHPVVSLAEASTKQLVDGLRHPSFRWRLQAQRLLVERGSQEALPFLLELLNDQSVDEVGLNVGAIHALWSLDGLSAIGPPEPSKMTDSVMTALAKALEHPAAGVRRNAVATLPHDLAGLSLLMNCPELFDDQDIQVKLQAILTLSDMPTADEAGALIAELAATESDPILVDALTAAAATHAVSYLRQLAAAPTPPVETGLLITRRIAEHLARSKPDASELQQIVSILSAEKPAVSAAILDGLTRGLPLTYRVAATPELNGAFVEAFQQVEQGMRGKLLQLASRTGIDALDAFEAEIVSALVAFLQSDEADADTQAAAARDLVGLRPQDAGAVETIVTSLTPKTPPEHAAKLFDALQLSEAESGGDVVIASCSSLTPATKAAAVQTILSKPAWVKSLLVAAKNGTFDLNELTLDQKQALRSFPDQKVREQAETLLAKTGGLPDPNRDKVLKTLLPLTKTTGDVDAGRAVFKKVCAACHQHGDMGHKIGPNLTGMAVHPKAELLTHIIDPSRNVEGNYRLYHVLTTDGRVFSGMLAGETKTSITIVDSQAKRIDVARDEIDELNPSRKSVMPEGFEKQLSTSELTDLLEFLTDAGPYIPLPLDRFATAVSTKGLFHDGDDGPDRMVFSDWSPKVFEGVPFVLTNPEGKRRPNIILLHGPLGTLPPRMPKSVKLPGGVAASTIYLLSGVGGWSFPAHSDKSVSMIVRLVYHDGGVEDHELRNGVHFADYIRRVDVPESSFAAMLGNQQVRIVSVKPKRTDTIQSIELIKGSDQTAPIVMAVTIERLSSASK